MSVTVNFKMVYRGDFWVFLNAVFWDQRKNMSSIESIVVRYRYYRIHISIDTIELVSIVLPSLLFIWLRVRKANPNKPQFSLVIGVN